MIKRVFSSKSRFFAFLFVLFITSFFVFANVTAQGDTSAVPTEEIIPSSNHTEAHFSFIEKLTRGIFGLVVLLLVSILISNNRRLIKWRMILSGLAMQFVLALSILAWPGKGVSPVYKVISWGAQLFDEILTFSYAGAEFLFKNFNTQQIEEPLINFAFIILPTIVFFAALSSLLYYLGILQWFVYGFAWVMRKTIRLSGSESLAAAANVFVGQTEAPLIVKPYVEKMTKSEIMCLMTGGMATIAGGVFAAFMFMLGGDDEAARIFFGTHLLTASIISAPAAVLIAKIMYPEDTPDQINDQMEIPKDKMGVNAIHAISNGTIEGLKLAVNVGAMLLVFIAFIAMFNAILGWVGGFTGLNDVIAKNFSGHFDALSLEFVFGLLFAPFAWLMGVPSEEVLLIGQMLGEKMIINEFIAYEHLGKIISDPGVYISERAKIITTYALCGFANFSSIGIQIGGIGTIAPNQRPLLSKFGVRAMIGGTIACFMTATIAGMLV